MPGFWIWAQIVESLSDIGYDTSDLYAHPYDWRLSPGRLEIRDGLLSRIKHTFEYSYEKHKKPACVLSHSYGDTLLRYFMSWVESDKGGKGGKGWVDKHIHRYVIIGGPMLGVPKVITAVTSGDTSDSIWLPDFAPYFTDRSILSKIGRAQWFRTMSSGSAMLPQGGEAIWGKASKAVDDTSANNNTAYSYGTFMCIRGDTKRFGRKAKKRDCVPLSVIDSIDLMFNRSGEETRKNFDIDEMHSAYSNLQVLGKKHRYKRTWGHALLEPLPQASKLKIYCFYGVGVPTERSYVYKYEEAGDRLNIDTSFDDPGMNIEHGIQYADGDGTVPLVSLGYLCVEGWRSKKLNPASVKVTTKEYVHDPMKLSLRGGPKASDHVNILGNREMITNILEIAGGLDVEGRIHSKIREMAEKVTRIETKSWL